MQKLLFILPLLLAAPAMADPAATIRNFAPQDILEGDDGMSPHPDAPLVFGKPVVHTDVSGNMIEEHAATISYFNGKYYLYGEKWACGKLVFFSGRIPGQGPAPKYPKGDYGGECGLAAWSSPDLTHWTFESLMKPKGPWDSFEDNIGKDGKRLPKELAMGTPARPQVHYSEKLGKYVMWFKSGGNLAPTGGLYVALADTPTGPWGDAQQATGDHLAHDFDIAIGPDGTGYIATDVFSGNYDKSSPGGSRPNWDVWVQKLNPELTGTLGGEDSKALVMKDSDFEAIGFFENGGTWYLTGGPTCGNCEVPIEYLSAPAPLGPWRDEAGLTGSDLKKGTVIAENGCTGQGKGVNVLPSPGGPVALQAVWGYRTSPTNFAKDGRVSHGDNSQAISSTYWFPLQFEANGRIKPMQCEAAVQVPLADAQTPQPTEHAALQPDCRIRKGTSLTQSFATPLETDGTLRLPLFQRTDDRGPYDQGGPVIDAPVAVTVTLADGGTVSRQIQPADVSWAPEVVDVALESGQRVSAISVSSEAENGCYGVMVAPKAEGADSYVVGGKPAAAAMLMLASQ